MATQPLDYATRQALLQKQALPPTAEARWMAAIEAQQAATGSTFKQASDAVRKGMPALFDAYVDERRYPHLRGQPLAKQADPASTYEAILKQADAQVATQPGLTRRAALIALVQEHPHEQAYHNTYRRYHLTDGIADFDTARRAKWNTGN
jgi:hypothetical protein